MNTLSIILVLLAGVVATHWASRALGGRIALPLLQVAAGAAIGMTTGFGVRLEPELFFLLFLPPLLFLDGWRVPKRALQDNAATILSLAFGLVFFTVLGLGLLLHILLPATPLGVCFALAAVLSPTDVVAATSITTGSRIPPRLLGVLEGEALFNDASGLVCLRLAVTATMTGAFSPGPALAGLAWGACGGIALGIALSFAISAVKRQVARRIGEDTSSQILISLLTPYGAYLLADAAGTSAVLAAVAAGMTMSWIEVGGETLAVTRIRRNAVWETLQFALNGSIFLLLGEQLPDILRAVHAGAAESGHQGGPAALGWLALYTLVLLLALAAFRFGWVWVSAMIWLRRHPAAPDGRRLPEWRLVSALSVAGVRGAVTLAGALSLPLFLPDGAPFPSRDLVICLAAGVILLSLAIANLALPRLLAGIRLPPAPAREAQEIAARIAATKAAIAALDKAREKGGVDLDTYVLVAGQYEHRLAQLQPPTPDAATAGKATSTDASPAPAIPHGEEKLHIAALRAERGAIVSLTRGRRLSTDLAHKLLREIDFAETAFEAAKQG
ncbi:Na+/H+ antiporter [Starkeya koreensis]|uniref:Na+/H+ antiporter n=1 Tax=Ancylobacter koreensis TaxID=266121 RepID=A0ABT0DHU1_9HYPH|nr:Na+/H+ antiporter [Ancylobacter koreensis]MCK0206834.1 Na+/H+ antiporter [Ancylobacter koreensis]